ncbi:ZIP zinc transporter-domain-containing protein [Baffinella frigidus]|nr:ZIP zinc transporter-domain-containing protein [Cryptophyta sp. CCMP2293]
MRAAAPALLGLTLLCFAAVCLSDAPTAEQRPRAKHVAALRLSRGVQAGFGASKDSDQAVRGRGHQEKAAHKAYSVREEDEHDEHDEHDDADDHDEHDEDDHDDEHEVEVSAADLKASLDLRIAAVFVTGIATLIGMSPFLITLKVSQNILLCVRAASAGTMLSLAVVHILPEAIHQLESVTTFPLASSLMVAGVFLAYLFQLVFQHAPHDSEEAETFPETLPSSTSTLPRPGSVATGAAGTSSVLSSNKQDPELGPGMVISPMAATPEGGMVHECCSCAIGTETDTDSQAGENRVSIGTDDRIDDLVVIRSMEVGCIVHSLILGLSLGLEPGFAAAGILLTVFSIHQFLEGLCLGYLITGLKSRTEKFSATSATMLSMPLGISIGLLVSVYGDTNAASNSAGPVTAGVSCVAGGLLLYSTLTNFLGEDLKRSDVLSSGKLRAAMGVAFFVGLAAMTSIAVGEAVSGGAH